MPEERLGVLRSRGRMPGPVASVASAFPLAGAAARTARRCRRGTARRARGTRLRRRQRPAGRGAPVARGLAARLQPGRRARRSSRRAAAMAAERTPPAAPPSAARLAEAYRPQLRVTEKGRVVSIGDGIAWIEGLPSAAMDEILRFEDGSRGAGVPSRQPSASAPSCSARSDGLAAGASAHLTGRSGSTSASATTFSAAWSIRWAARSTAGRHPGRSRRRDLEVASPPIIGARLRRPSAATPATRWSTP